jgi:UDP-N-acetylglucosamine acyltransferase
VLQRRVSVQGHTTIGSGNFIAEGCVLGCEPQDLKYAGGVTFLTIGHRNRLERYVTAHIGTENGGFLTRIGDDNVLKEGCHIGHDSYVDDRTAIGRQVQLAGHIRVHHGAVLEDLAGVLQFVTIGRYARVGRCTPVRLDVPPFTSFCGQGGDVAPVIEGIHEEGIAAAKLTPDEEKELRHALADLFLQDGALQTKIEQVVNLGVEGEVADLCQFCQRSLGGIGGRHRELYRGKIPPEAEQFLPHEWRQAFRRSAT